MIVLGLVLLLLGFFLNIQILWILGVILLIVGIVLNFVPIGGSRRRVF